MLRTFLICCLFSVPAFSYDHDAEEQALPSTPEQVTALSSETEHLIGGVIDPLSGNPSLRQTDLVVRGAQELTLSRTYVAPHIPVEFTNKKQCKEEWEKCYLQEHLHRHYKGWQFYPHIRLDVIPSEKRLLVTQPNGATLGFIFKGPGMTDAQLEGKPYGISNCVGETPSGAHDLRNIRIKQSEDGHVITVYGTDRKVRIYRFRWRSDPSDCYLLEKEILPNGKILKYHYASGQLARIESLDPKEQFVYASIQITGDPCSRHFLSSLGHTAHYHYDQRKIHFKIKEIIKKRWYGNKKFKRERTHDCPPILTKASTPQFRKETLNYTYHHLLDTYEGKERHCKMAYSGYGEGSGHYRVSRLSFPVGDQDACTPVYEMSYQVPIAGEKEGTTTITSAIDGTSIVHHFSKHLLTSKIQYFDEQRVLKKEKLFSWDDHHHLKSIELRDGHGAPLYKKSFECDSFGNPISETLTGDLTGSLAIESTTTKRLFSDDGNNLLLREEQEHGTVTSFSYLKNTTLPTSKLIKERDAIILRHFWIYDEHHNLIETISDDGSAEAPDDLSGITQRNKTTYILRTTPPFLHMPEYIIETYLDPDGEKPLKKTHFTYDPFGNIAREEIYDAEGRYAYTLEKSYNQRGDLLSQSNRLGHITTYTYDDKGRITSQTHPSGRRHTTYTYDKQGRLCTTLEQGDDGTSHKTFSHYDPHNRLIQEEDPFGNSTYYTYDPLLREITQTTFPNMTALDGTAREVKNASCYDPFGREIAYTDPNGNTTTYTYNTYGSKTQICHPSGGKETLCYAKNGDLISHTDPDALTITHQRDVLGRVLKTSYLSPTGETLATETYTYAGHHLTSKTDREGHTTHYTYDGAGRTISESRCQRVTQYTYDPLGRLATTHKHNGDDALVTHYDRDLEDRILCEKKTNLAGHLLCTIAYSYDADGNRTSITRHINEAEAEEQFTYDPFGRTTHYRDALGYATLTSYDEHHTNHLGQKVLQIKTTDPKGVITLRTQDALKREIRVEKQTTDGKTLSHTETLYDPQGNPILHKDHIYQEGALLSTQEIRYFYTPDHQIDTLITGHNTPDARKTKCRYSQAGKMVEKTLPDGITLIYSHHPLGFITRIDSSDQTIAHSFSHNALGDLLIAHDEHHDLKITREVDPFGNVITETFPHTPQITKTYDDFDRPLSLTIAGHGQVHYSYDPLFLRTVERRSTSGHPLYTHTYQEYDLSGHLVQESLIGDLGTIHYTTDARGQKTHTKGPYFSEQCQYDALQNLISIQTDGKPTSYHYDDTSQISRERGLLDISYTHDSLYNRTQKNQTPHTINHLNELLFDGHATYEYDLRGNRIFKKSNSKQHLFHYDPLNRLIAVETDTEKTQFLYDPLGRRLAKITQNAGTTHYLYDGEQEIGSFSNQLDTFRMLSPHSRPHTLSIELANTPFAPITDIQGNIRRLIDINSKNIAAHYDFTAFGEILTNHATHFNPWQYASKRLDPHLNLIYFGKRDYDPTTGRWLTPDPALFEDSVNPYQYAFNSPFCYYDPQGESLLGYLWGLGQMLLGGAVILSGGVLEVATVGGFTIGLGITTTTGLALITSGLATSLYHAHDLSLPRNASTPRSHDASMPWNTDLLISDWEDWGTMLKKPGNKKGKGPKKEKKREYPDKRPEQMLDENPGLKETTHPKAAKKGQRMFENPKTGEKFRYDLGKPGESGHEGRNHWHQYNPDPKTKRDFPYLDKHGNPVKNHSPASHLYFD